MQSKKSCVPDGYEPIGDLKFEAVDFVGLGPTNDEWCAKQVPWLAVERMARVFMRSSDAELEVMIRDAVDPDDAWETMMTACEQLIERKQWYEGGAEMMGAASGRIMIVLERIYTEPEGGAA